jgi:hypothetical protein
MFSVIRNYCFVLAVFLASLPFNGAAAGERSATVVVAPSDASDAIKAAADLVAEGRDDERVLAASLARGALTRVMIDASPADMEEVTARGRFSVRWLPGVYRLDAPLVIPDTVDAVIEAEGAVLEYRGETGDAVTVTGMYRSRYRFGTITTAVAAGAALRIAPTAAMPALMSEISFTGLVGTAGTGVGLALDASMQNVTTNKISGTDVGGFETCVKASPPRPGPNRRPGFGKMDTNHFWLSYVRRCRTAILVGGGGVDSNVWDVNVDASLEGSVAIRTAAAFDRWRVIMGVWGKDGTALILDPGAHDNVFDVTPPLGYFRRRDDSGNRTNVLLGADNLGGLPGPAPQLSPESVRLLEQGIGPDGRYNLLAAGGRLVAVRQDLGPVDLSREYLGGRDMPPMIYRGPDAAAVLARLSADGRSPEEYIFETYGDGAAAYASELDGRLIGREFLGRRSLPPWLIVGDDRAEIDAALVGLSGP